MSDAQTITLTRRKVMRNSGAKGDGLYYVYQHNGRSFRRLGRGYPHSTSAYAKLGRITSDATTGLIT